jgi:hypothetical protein
MSWELVGVNTTSTREYENRSLFAWPFLGIESGYIFHLEALFVGDRPQMSPILCGSEASFLIFYVLRQLGLPSTA